MIDSISIYNQATELVKQCGNRNPEKIIKELGIMVIPLDTDSDLLGMYTFRWNHRIILMNQRLETYMRKMVLAHELGHDQRHRNLAKKDGMKEFTLFNMKNNTEYEANAFAAHILLDTDEVYFYAKQGYNVVELAQMMNTDINLMLIKLQEMNQLEYRIPVPMQPDGKFLKNIKGSQLPEVY